VARGLSPRTLVAGFVARDRLRALVVRAVFCATPLALALPGSLGAQGAALARESELDCLIQPREVVSISSPVDGIIERVTVDRGDRVREGAVLVALESSMERAAVAVARARTEQESGMKSSQTRLEFGARRFARTDEMYRKELVPLKELDEAETAKILAEHGVLETGENLRIAALELERAVAALALRTIKSPFAGVVLERLQHPGEFADAKKGPILRMARLDPLRVEVFVPVSLVGRMRVGTRAVVIPEPPFNTPHEATVTVVDHVADAASGTFGVRLEMPNPDHRVPAGLKCRVRFSR
jgi:RND family efflux transporter MFP subunit